MLGSALVVASVIVFASTPLKSSARSNAVHVGAVRCALPENTDAATCPAYTAGDTRLVARKLVSTKAAVRRLNKLCDDE